MQDLSRNDNMPHNILNRSDAELAKTRQNFLDQYEMINQYKMNTGPSYKFTMSTKVIDSVAEVLENNTVSKEYVLDKQKSKLNQNSMTASKTVTTRVGSNRRISKDDSNIIGTHNHSKKLLQSYDDGKPFYQ